jgi:hypothetical protein
MVLKSDGRDVKMPPKRKNKDKKEASSSKKRKKDVEPAPLEDDTDDEEEGEQEYDVPEPTAHSLRLDMKQSWSDELMSGEQVIPVNAYPKIQKLNLNWHVTGRSAGVIGAGKLVPPMHKAWKKSDFKKNMPPSSFLDVLTNPKKPYLDIIKWEIDYEVAMKWKVENGRRAESSYFQKRMQWMGWSAMLQMELTYPDRMESCQGFPQCFEHLFKEIVADDHADEIGTAEFNAYFDDEVMGILTSLNTIIHYVWQDSGSVEPSSVRTWVTHRTLNPIRAGDLFKRRHADLTEKGFQKAKQELVRAGPLSVPESTAGALRKGGQDRLEQHLMRPQTIPESEITAGVRKLVQQIWGEKMDTSGVIELEEKGSDSKKGLTDKAKAAVCLLELMCGSRAIGILFVNFFTQLRGATMAEWEKDKTKQYGAYERCVRVERLSKEGTKAARAEKHSTAMEEVVDRVIVKPLNTHFVNPAFLDPEQYATKTEEGIRTKAIWVGDEQAVSIFLRLCTSLREYVFRPHRAPSYGAVVQKVHGMKCLSDEQVENMPKEVRNYLASMVGSVNTYARLKFGFFRKGKGTHLFRKIYVNWAYNAFASNSMKEVGFASEVLGHRGYKVSLNYVSLIIKPSFSGELKDHVTTRQALSDMTDRIDAQANTMEALQSRLYALEHVEKVEEEEELPVDKLPRAERGTTYQGHVERGLGVFFELLQKGIQPTWRNLRRLGVYSTSIQDIMKLGRPERKKYDVLGKQL